MSGVRFALATPHAKWLPERAKSFERLQAQLENEISVFCRETNERIEPVARQVFDEREPNYVWARRIWDWAVDKATNCVVEQDATHLLQLQDDVIIAPNFLDAVYSMVRSRPDDIICLQTAHPAARILAREGRRWMTTSDGLVGVGYVFPIGLLREFLDWVDTCLPLPGAVTRINEDTLIALWCVMTGRRVWHPIPSPLRHDTSILSTYANDAHTMRTSIAPWTNADIEGWWEPGWWEPTTARHIGRVHGEGLRQLALAEIGVDDDVKSKWRADDIEAASENRRLHHAALAQVDRKDAHGVGAAKIFVCTPTRGGLHREYASSIWRLLMAAPFEVECAFEVVDVELWGEDVVRTRSRFVEHFLSQTDATHLLFVDSDVSFDPMVVVGMLRSGKDCVMAPYPRRDSIDFARARETPGDLPAAAAAYRYSLQLLPGELAIAADGTAEIEGCGLGCALLSRALLQKMRNFYDWELLFRDTLPDGQIRETVALFNLIRTADDRLLSEDYSFCRRVRMTANGKVYLYLGPGSPVTHHGEHAYEGAIESFGVRRVPA